jgi:transposase-like protein
MEKTRKSENKFVKCGFSPNGKQLWKNKETGKRSIADEDRAKRGFGDATKKFAVKMYLEGTGLRSIGRLLRCSHASVINWVRAAGKRLPPLSSTLMEKSKVGIAELDEMWHFF